MGAAFTDCSASTSHRGARMTKQKSDLDEAVIKVAKLSLFGFWLGVVLGSWVGWCCAMAYYAWDL